MNLKNKVVVITGASRGLGKALTEVFSERKAKLILGARSKDQLEQVTQEIHAPFMITDVSDEKSVQSLQILQWKNSVR